MPRLPVALVIGVWKTDGERVLGPPQGCASRPRAGFLTALGHGLRIRRRRPWRVAMLCVLRSLRNVYGFRKHGVDTVATTLGRGHRGGRQAVPGQAMRAPANLPGTGARSRRSCLEQARSAADASMSVPRSAQGEACSARCRRGAGGSALSAFGDLSPDTTLGSHPGGRVAHHSPPEVRDTGRRDGGDHVRNRSHHRSVHRHQGSGVC